MKSNYKGVTWSAKMQSWMVQLYHNNQKIHVGTFKGKEREREAAKAYDLKRISLGLNPENILKPLKRNAA